MHKCLLTAARSCQDLGLGVHWSAQHIFIFPALGRTIPILKVFAARNIHSPTSIRWHLRLVSTLSLLLQHLTHWKYVNELLKCNYRLMPINQTAPGKWTIPRSVFKTHGSRPYHKYIWITVTCLNSAVYLKLLRPLVGPNPTQSGADDVNTAGQVFLVANLACTGATLWISMQTCWYSSKGKLVQSLQKWDPNTHTCFSFEKTFLFLQLE